MNATPISNRNADAAIKVLLKGFFDFDDTRINNIKMVLDATENPFVAALIITGNYEFPELESNSFVSFNPFKDEVTYTAYTVKPKLSWCTRAFENSTLEEKMENIVPEIDGMDDYQAKNKLNLSYDELAKAYFSFKTGEIISEKPSTFRCSLDSWLNNLK